MPELLPPAATEGAYGPITQFLQALGIGQGYQTPAQKYQANMYDPFRTIWGLQQPINTMLGGPEATSPSWGEYLTPQNLGGGMRNVYGQAAAILQKLLGATPEERQLGGLGFEPQYDSETGEQVTEGEVGSPALREILRLGTAQRFGPIGSKWLASRLPALEQNWQLGQAGGGIIQTFLDYLRQKYNL